MNLFLTFRQHSDKTTTRIKINDNVTDNITIATGIRQSDSLNPVLFNIVMDRITNVKGIYGNNVNMICYGGDVILIANNVYYINLLQ